MRISDWSSDVCSSDLRDGVWANRTIRKLSQIRGQVDRVLVGFPIQRRCCRSRLFGEVGRLLMRVDCAAERLVNMLTHTLRHVALAALDVIADGPLARTHRSEEHTSELQSLMRTSYAVFCLK